GSEAGHVAAGCHACGGCRAANATDRRTSVVWQRTLGTRAGTSYLVDPASSHMLVSKTKPRKCKRTPL
ncbi:hypothetical protein M514_28091, partial [Trichuris suis]